MAMVKLSLFQDYGRLYDLLSSDMLLLQSLSMDFLFLMIQSINLTLDYTLIFLPVSLIIYLVLLPNKGRGKVTP